MDDINLHVLNAAGDFQDSQVEKIRINSFQVLSEINRFLPPTNLDIVFLHAPAATVSGEYIGGRSTSASTIFIYFDTGCSDLDMIIEEKLPAVLAHEYHHACRWKTVGYGNTLGEALVTEGLADHFSLQVFKGGVPKWCCALTESEIKTWLKKASKELENKDYDHIAWFFGDNKTFPGWVGYSLGYFIVEKYLRRFPPLTAADLVDTDAKEILAESY